jgi:hypothetical protein
MIITQTLYQNNTATPANGYSHLFAGELPRWAMAPAVPADDPFYTGHGTLYTAAHIRAWLPAALIWTSFVVVLLLLCSASTSSSASSGRKTSV